MSVEKVHSMLVACGNSDHDQEIRTHGSRVVTAAAATITGGVLLRLAMEYPAVKETIDSKKPEAQKVVDDLMDIVAVALGTMFVNIGVAGLVAVQQSNTDQKPTTPGPTIVGGPDSPQ